MNVVINEWLSVLSTLLTQNLWFAPAAALLAGLLTALTPCSLSTIPLVIGYVGSMGQKNTKRSFLMSLVFAAGMAVTFTSLATAASLLGKILQGAGSWWYLLLGTLMVLMALQTWEIINIVPSTYAVSKNKKRGIWGAFAAGILGGFFSSPCTTPALIALLAIVAKEGSLFFGIMLLLLYSAGHSVLVILAGTSVGFVQKLSSSAKYGTLSKFLKIILGAVILIIAFYMFYLGF